MGKVITVNVHCVDGVTCVTDANFFHKDFGSQLVINGLNLETGTQVHFSLTEKRGKPISMIGVSDNGIFTVDVPDNVLNSNSKRDDYEIYAFVYCTEENSGWTEHEIVIPVKMRPDKEFEQPTSEELTAFDKVTQYVSETAESIAGDREQISKNKEDIEYLKEHGADNVKIEVDKELSTKSENPIANKAVAKEFEKYGGTVEITEDIESSKEKSVMIINTNAEEVLLYTAEEVDAIVEELRKNGVSEEDIANEVKKYLDENPIEVDVPENLSDLNDDAEHRTVTDKEKEAWNSKLDADKLQDAVNTALAQAKESGDFDGKDGEDGKDGQDGYTPKKGEDYFTDEDKNELVDAVINALPTWEGGEY